MAANPKASAAIFIDRTGLTYYTTEQPAPVRIDFPPEIVVALDIVDNDGFSSLITEHFTTEHAPTEIMVVFVDKAYFIKDITPDPKNKSLDDPEATFLNIVPFETILSRNYTVSGKKYICVINADMFYALKQQFEALGYTIGGVVPEIDITEKAEGSNVNSPEGFQLVVRKWDELKKNSMDSLPALQDSPDLTDQPVRQAPYKSVLPLLAPVMLILLGILGFMVYRMNEENAALAKKPIPTLAPLPTRALSPSPAASSSALLDLSVLKVQVQNGSGTPGEATRVKEALEDAEFENVVTTNSDVENTKNTQVVVVKDVPQSVRQKLLDTLQDVVGAADIRETATASFDISILTGSAEDQ